MEKGGVMVETVIMWGMMILLVLAGGIGVLLVAGYIAMLVYRKRAHQAIVAMKAGFAEALQGTTDISRKALPAWTCALIFALRQHKRKQVKMWLSESIERLEEMTESLPLHVIGVCKELEKFRNATAFELHKQEQAAMTCAILCRQAVYESLDATCSVQEQLHTLVTDDRCAVFSLQDERLRVSMLKNAIEASKASSASEANEHLHRLLVQTRVLTECALEAARITADKAFIDIAWTSIDVRLDQLNHAFSFVTSWAVLMSVASDDWYAHHAQETLEELKVALADIARMRDVARGIDVGKSISPIADVFFLRCRLSHSALADAEDMIRGLMTSLSDAVLPKKDRQAVVH